MNIVFIYKHDIQIVICCAQNLLKESQNCFQYFIIKLLNTKRICEMCLQAVYKEQNGRGKFELRHHLG